MPEPESAAMEFVEPPPVDHRRRGGESTMSDFWLDVMVRCKARPGRWLFIGRRPASQVTRINRGRIAPLRGAGWQATARGVDADRRADIYGRFNPPAEDET